MRYATADNGEKIEATPGAKGTCPGCGSQLIAKCGPVKINHWAHIGKRHCDPWWENETEWHREWKDHFPAAWQEICLEDRETNEKHIADVRADNGIVVEFQHSFIKQEEIASRERFYKNMVWVVDGTRLKTDLSRFHKNKDHLRNIWKGALFLNPFPEETFNKNWLGKTKPVFFDFSGPQKRVPEGKQKLLVCLLPDSVDRGSVVLLMLENEFVELIESGQLSAYLQEVYKSAQRYDELASRQARSRKPDLLAMNRRKTSGYRRTGRRRF